MRKSKHRCPESEASAYMQYNEMTTQREKKYIKTLFNREMRRFEKKLLDNQKPIPQEINEIVNDNFWSLI